MLVLTLTTNEPVTLYTQDGKEIGSIQVVQSQGSKVRVAFKMRDDIAIARNGISKEVALNLAQKNREKYHELQK